ncbi:MAG TPA: mannosyl-3-phosphoglycerate phosphatase, partial [Methylophaga sp.]|nr:mannosyl-3-phosphoglycerate phosphatase [Methylophaga sp.]
IIAMTGLDVHAAARAARRQYGEALAWHGNPGKQKQFIEEVRKRGAQVLIGGRFLHVS